MDSNDARSQPSARTPTRPPTPTPDAGSAASSLPRAPWISLGLMALFVLGGTLVLLVRWPQGPANIDWGVWLLVYGGYLFLVAAALLHARTGR